MSRTNHKNEKPTSSHQSTAKKTNTRSSRRKPKAVATKPNTEAQKKAVATPVKKTNQVQNKSEETVVKKKSPPRKNNRRRGKRKPPVKAKARDIRLKIKEGEKAQILAEKRTNQQKAKAKKQSNTTSHPAKNTKKEQRTQEENSTPKRTTRPKTKDNQIAKETTSNHSASNIGNSKSETNTISVRVHQTVAVLIDGNNIEMSIHSMMHSKSAMLDFDKVIPKILEDRGLNRLIYFREGLNISEKLAERLHKHYHGSVVPCHKSADIPLTITATQIAGKVDTIIIMSGDSDYVELVRHLKSRGVRVEIASVKATTAQILIDEADYSYEINKEDCFVFK